MPILAPKTTFNIIGARTVQQNADQRVLLVCQMLTGTATAASIYRDCPDSETEINALFGAKSHAAEVARTFKSINKATALDILPLADNGSGVAATATITAATATSSADATITVWVMDKTKYTVDVTIPSGSDQAAVAAAIDAAFSAVETKWPFVTTSASAVVTFTAQNKGTWANNAPIGIEGTIPGVALTIVAFASGATDPILTSVLDVVGNQRYQTIGWPTGYARTVLKAFLDARFNDDDRVLDGVGVQVKADTYNNLSTGPTDNSQSLVVLVDALVSKTARKGGAVMTLNDNKMSAFCAVRSLRLTADASLTAILSTVSASDQFGGSGTSTLPYHNTLLAGMPVPSPEDEFSVSQVESLTGVGYSVLGANSAYNSVILGQIVTTYQTNAAGDADTSFKFLNRVDASSAIREYYAVNCKARYAQTRLTNGELIAGRDMANEASIRTFCKRLYENLADEAIVEKGPAATKDFDANLSVEVEVGEGKVTIAMAPLQVGQYRTQLGTIAVNFSS